MERKALKALAAAAVLAASTTAATAGTSPFSLVSGASNPTVDVTLTIQASSQPDYAYDFVISNNSLMGTVTGVYFELNWNRLLSGAGTPFGPADMEPSSLNPAIEGWTGSKAAHTVQSKTTPQWIGRGYRNVTTYDMGWGIEAGESQTYAFKTDTDKVSLADLTDMLATDGYGVAIRMQGLTEDAQATGWGEVLDNQPAELLVVQRIAVNDGPGPSDNEGPKVTGAPTPTAALAGVAMLGIVSLRRRRK
ncbi:MAG: hypothetical protein ACPGYV_12190 [Phycisphaeraceae bacterium]